MLPNVGPMELVVVLVIALLVLGPAKLPEAGKSVGRGLKEFKDAISGKTDEADDVGRHPHDPPFGKS